MDDYANATANAPGRTPHAPSRWAAWVVVLLIVAYVLTFATLSVLKHESYNTSVFDLGNVDQALWNTAHGRFLHFTTQRSIQGSRLGMHVEPVLVPLAVLYLFAPDPRLLLVIQTLALALGAWPVFRLARWKLGSGLAAVVFALAYLLFPALESANMFEFHAVTLATPALLWAFYSFEMAVAAGDRGDRRAERRAYRLFALSILFALTCKEDISLLVVMLGLYIALWRRKWRVGGPLVAIGALWFAAAFFVIMPHFRPERGGSPFWRFYADVLAHPQNLWGVLGTPDNAWFVVGLLAPFAFLPLLSPPTLALIAPSLAINLLSANPLMHRLEDYHYAAPMAPFVVVSAIYGAHSLAARVRAFRNSSPLPQRGSGHVVIGHWLLVIVLFFALGYHRFRGYSPLAMPFRGYRVTEHNRLARRFINLIPPDAIAAAQPNLVPHLSQREQVYVWPYRHRAEYILLDVSYPPFHNRANPDAPDADRGAHTQLKEKLARPGRDGIIASGDGYILLQKDAPFAPLSDDFYSFVRVDDPAPQYPMAVDFGPLRLLGFDVILDRDKEPLFNLYWQATAAVGEDYFIALYLLDERGAVVGASSQPQPVLVWYPTSRWQPGETIRVVGNTLGWATWDRRAFGLALGVMRGTDPWEVSARLRPDVLRSELLPRLPSDGTLLRLMDFRRVWGMVYPRPERRRFRPPRVQHSLSADLGGRVRLVGYDVDTEPGVVHLTLYWQAQRAMDVPYTVFTHLLGGGQVWGQRDSQPGGGRADDVRELYPTTVWLPGEYVADRYDIPLAAEAPFDDYLIEVGMYDARTGQRLPVGAVGDSVILGPVRVER